MIESIVYGFLVGAGLSLIRCIILEYHDTKNVKSELERIDSMFRLKEDENIKVDKK